MRATWNGEVIAESSETVVVEGNHYFPPTSVRMDLLTPNPKTTTCPWKGEASYYDITVGDQTNSAAAWYYPAPKAAAEEITGRVAFWKGVDVTE